MALDYKVEAVPEGLESYYKETSDGFVLDVEGVVDEATYNTTKTEAEENKKKVKEFREHNVQLRKQVEGAIKAPDGGEPPNIEALIEESVKEMKAEMNRTVEERNTLRSQLEEVVLSDRVKDIAIRHGVFETALPDVVTRAKGVFTVKDGKPVPVDTKARDEAGELYTPDTWLKKLEADAPHLFKPSSGSGAHRPVNGSGRGNDTRSSTDKIASGLGGPKQTKNVM